MPAGASARDAGGPAGARGFLPRVGDGRKDQEDGSVREVGPADDILDAIHEQRACRLKQDLVLRAAGPRNSPACIGAAGSQRRQQPCSGS